MTELSLPSQQGALSDKDGRTSPQFYSWFRRIQDALDSGLISQEEAQTLIDELTARVTALEDGHTGDELLAAMYGTNGITIFGSIDSGVEIRGPGVAAAANPSVFMLQDVDIPEPWPLFPPVVAAVDSFVPYYIAASETFTVPEYKQALFTMPITVDGAMVVDGYLVEV